MQSHFERLYSDEGEVDLNVKERLLDNTALLINSEDNDMLNQSVTKMEIYGIILQMNLDKASGPDGLSSHFYLK